MDLQEKEKPWRVISNADGVDEEFTTLPEAIKGAEEVLALWRDQANDEGEWDEDVEGLEIHLLTHAARITMRDGDNEDDGVDYGITEIFGNELDEELRHLRADKDRLTQLCEEQGRELERFKFLAEKSQAEMRRDCTLLLSWHDMTQRADAAESALTQARAEVERLTKENYELNDIVSANYIVNRGQRGLEDIIRLRKRAEAAEQSEKVLQRALEIISDTDPASIGEHDDVCGTCCGMRETASEALEAKAAITAASGVGE